MQNPLPKCTTHQPHSTATTRVTGVKRRGGGEEEEEEEEEEEDIKFASQMPCMKHWGKRSEPS